ncbi:homoserine dehydrogenase [Anaerobacillus sp. MEB173]|uniref:homoserine dehydrogenase n=1 Tax=Anaerobacillus sp. MEB173 TaxID=3383345 RepID=UPI003F91204A
MIEIGLIGLGTVGLGVFEGVAQTEKELEHSLGDKVRIKKILVKNKSKKRNIHVDESILTEEANEFLSNDYHVIFEAIGGIEPAKSYIQYYLQKGIPVITANKELVAKHGQQLEQVAIQNNTFFGYEAAVAGGIPIVNVLRSNLQWGTVEKVSGIINGTTNYILTEMNEKGRDFPDVLKETQQLGYAEADPTDDIHGYDAWYKIRILGRLCFGYWPQENNITVKGISEVKAWQVEMAKELGLTLKLVAEASFNGENIVGSVKPSFLTSEHPLHQINGVTNAVSLTINPIGELLVAGPGAGKGPTSASMIEDYLHHFQKKQYQSLKKRTLPIASEMSQVLIFVQDHIQRNELEAVLDSSSVADSYIYEYKGVSCWLVTVSELELEKLEDANQIHYYPVYGNWEPSKVAVIN